MYISLHIPKTAGTTVGYILDYGVKRRIYYDYSQLEGKHQKKEFLEDIDLHRRHKEFLDAKFNVIHGHFHYKKYCEVFDDAKYLVCLREPLSRTISQYYHIIEEADPNHWLYKDLSSGKMDLVSFASLPNIRRAQSSFIDGRDIMDFDHVFITEDLAKSVYQFQKNHNFHRSDPYMNFKGAESIPNLNPRTARKQSRKKFSDDMLKKTKQILVEDVELYQRALQKMAAQSKWI
ncbi:sulfotransferase family 2 domain-containing protein [Candidatus Pacearchaeota archaeon]|nr:sulfotransferase family 2 domain-containing protein [Candidatus Pacearchaeota archaeon]